MQISFCLIYLFHSNMLFASYLEQAPRSSDGLVIRAVDSQLDGKNWLKPIIVVVIIIISKM